MSMMNKRPEVSGGSFLPEDYLRRRGERRSIAISLGLFLVVTMGIVGAFFVTHRQWNVVKSRQLEINKEYALETQKIEQLTKLEEQIKEQRDRAEVATALIEKVPRSIMLAELINRMPKQLTLTELNLKSKRITENVKPTNAKDKPKVRSLAGPQTKSEIDAKKVVEAKPPPVAPKYEFRLEMIGLSGADEDVADYVSALNQCPLLQKVDLMYSGATTVDDVEMRKFRIEAVLRPQADARQIEPLHVPRLPSIPGLTGPSRSYDPDDMDPTKPRKPEKTTQTNAGKE